ncbi:MAG: thioredoxin domain-containing protein, partial [Singulisphaera sp.]
MPRRSDLWSRVALSLVLVAIPWAASLAAAEPKRPANRLAKETSPYLLLHAHNPVDWYPWGPEAFAKAKAEDKPVFLSIGYSSCYWCHVMERECFMDPAIAKLLNERFVSVKVDREERPDVDQVYMTALQAFGNGGWPMSMFLTPDGRPFYGGTYFPPKERQGMPAFPTILQGVVEAWRDERPAVEKSADRLAGIVRRSIAGRPPKGRVPVSRAAVAEGRARLADRFDPEYGGFGYSAENARRPKFPEPVNLVFLLDQHRRDASKAGAGGKKGDEARPGPLAMVLTTMDHMARGGIRDQLAGGYHRYSTGRSWVVPHFEKMLYDNAQLASAHLLAFEATGDPRWRAEAEATFAFVERSMTSPEGGFFSALDAETEGEEGAYYVWSREQVQQALGKGEASEAFAQVYGMKRDPNFEKDRYVLLEPRSRADQAQTLKTTPEALEASLAPLRAKLLAVRDARPSPVRDDKVLTSWNGLMIAAYADGFRLLKDAAHRQAAETAADFLLTELRTPDGRLLRTYRGGTAKLPAYLEDYAFLAHGLLRLHAATGDPKRLAQARELTDRMIADFTDTEQGGFFYTADDHESLLARPKDPYDNALPSGNSVAIRNLVALADATGEPSYLDHAGKALDAFSSAMAQNPAAL